MSLNASRTKLAALSRDLFGRWQQTREYWKDAKSAEFDQKFMQELLACANAALTNIESLDKILNKVRSDCE